MDNSIVISSAFLPFHKSKRNLLLPITPFSKTPQKPSSKISITANYSSNYSINPSNKETPLAKTLQIAGKTLIFTVAATLMASKINEFPAKAEPLTPTVEESTVEEDKVENFNKIESGVEEELTLSQLVKSYSELVENLWSQLQKKLEIREDEEALKILDKLVEVEPYEMEWKYVRARLLSEMGKIQEAIKAFDEILELNPLHIEALFEIALIMDSSELGKLGKVLRKARKLAMGRDFKLISSQLWFLLKLVDEALSKYDKLIMKDPKDCRPYFCKGMIYSLIDWNAKAKQQFAKYWELSPNKYKVDGFLSTPLSKMKISEIRIRVSLKFYWDFLNPFFDSPQVLRQRSKNISRD